MKKILAIILASLMILSALAFVACDDKDDGKKEETSKTEVTTVANVTEETTEEETEADEVTTVAEETTKSGELFEDEEEIDVFDAASATHNPLQINDKSKGTGVQFVMPEGKWLNAVKVQCPSYSDDFGSLTFYVYKWDTDFSTTVAAEPIYKETFEDYADNATLEMLMDDKNVTNGTYIFIIKDGIDTVGQGVGVWTGDRMDEYDQEDYAEYQIVPITNGKIAPKSRSIAKITLVVGYYD